MKMKRYILMSILCFFCSFILAQTFKGRVTDVKGDPVPFASLYLKELKWGLTTDDNGCFQTTLKPGKYTCEVSSLGYTTQSLSIQISEEGLEKNIKLAERIYTLKEVNIVKGAEDPAYAVMRKVIANAPYYRTLVKGFKAGTYLKGTGKATSIPAILKLSKEVRTESKKYLGKLFLLEEQREVTFTAPDKWENRIKAYSNTFPDEVKVEIGLTTINFYEPTIFNKVSPLTNGAFSYYRFKLDGCYFEDGRLVNKIKVIPKKDNPNLLSGYLYIIDELWCVSAADFDIRMSGLQAKVKVTCKEVQRDIFLATSTSMNCAIGMMGLKAEASYLAAVHYVKVDVGGQKNEKVPEIPVSTTKIRQESRKQEKLQKQIEELSLKDDLTMREAYKLSRLMEKSIYEEDTLQPKHKYERLSRNVRNNVVTDSLADKKDSLYWTAIRSVPLKPEEIQSYVEKRTLFISRDTLRKDSLHKPTVGGKIFKALFVGDTYKTNNKKAWISLFGLSSYIPEYNFVDGFWLGARTEAGIKLSETTVLKVVPSLYYTSARHSLIGEGKITLNYLPRRNGQFTLSGGAISADYNSESGESRFINSVASSLFGRNDIKLYNKRFLNIEHEIELANSFLLSTSLSWQRRNMLENHISKSWFKREAQSNIPRSEAFHLMPENELLRASFAVEYTPVHYYRMIDGRKIYEDSGFSTFTLRYDRAFPLSGTRISPSYHLAEFTARQKLEFGMFNRIFWLVNAGMFWKVDKMEFPDYKHFAATRLPVTERTFNTGFSLIDNYAFSTDKRWAQANISWYTPYLLLKQLPFLRKKAFDEALHVRSVVVYGCHPYSEVGYSVGVSDMARIGVFVGFDNLHYRSTGVSISIPLSAFNGGEFTL